jgi:hypothetical protein
MMAITEPEYERLNQLRADKWVALSKIEQRHIKQRKTGSIDPKLDALFRQVEKEYYELECQCNEHSEAMSDNG